MGMSTLPTVTTVAGAKVTVNRFFLNRPEMVLGSWSRKDTLYGEGYSVTSTGDLAQQLRAAVAFVEKHNPVEAKAEAEAQAASEAQAAAN